jgi:hypothetical protein
MQALWRIDGFTSPARPSGTVPRNTLGSMDGIANPDTSSRAQMARLVWIQPGPAGAPAWAAGGSYFVVRLIRMLVEFWDRVDITEQEHMIGRRRASGYPLDATSIGAAPNYPADPSGAVIPLTSHNPAGQPADAADRGQPHPAPRLQLRPRHRPGGRSGHRADFPLFPAGHQAAVRDRADPAGPASRSPTTSARSAAGTSWPCPAWRQRGLPGPRHAGVSGLRHDAGRPGARTDLDLMFAFWSD